MVFLIVASFFVFIGIWITLIIYGTKLAKQNKYSGVILLNIALPGNKMGKNLYRNSAYQSISEEISNINGKFTSNSVCEKTDKEKLQQAFLDNIISSEEYNKKLDELSKK